MGTYAGVIVAVAAVAGTAISAYAAYSSAESQSAANRYQSKVARNQALQAQYAAEVAERQERQRNRLILSRQNAVYAASGLDPAAGTPLLVMADSARQAELDALNIRWSGQLQSGSFSAESALRRFEARQASTAGYLRVGSSLLSGAGSAAEAYGRTRTGTSPIIGGSGGEG